MIMRGIEPELVTANLGVLDVSYKGESVEDHAKRYRGYSKAFELYQKAYRTWKLNAKNAVHAYKHAITCAAERMNATGESSILASLEGQISAA